MTFQQPQATEQPVNAQETFNKNTSKPHIIVDNTLHDKEAVIAKEIAQSRKPLIIITDQYAAREYVSYGMMKKALPNAPIVAESLQAMRDMRRSHFYDREIMRNSCVGHFIKPTNDYSSMHNDVCQEIQSSDCIVIIGSPTDALRADIKNHPKVFINETNAAPTKPRINFSLIMDIKGNKSEWKIWRNSLMQRPSL